MVKADLVVVRGGGASLGYSLDELPQERIGLRVQLGADAWCAETPAKAAGDPPTTVANDRPGRFTAAPKSPPPAACPVTSPDFALTVGNGYGSGRYPAGAAVHVWAAVRPQDQLVTGWSGDAALLGDPEEWHTILTMPARDATVTATVVDRSVTLVVSQFTGTTARPKTVRSFIPAGARGLVLFLHGTPTTTTTR